MTEFPDMVVMVTGAAGNLGQAAAQAFHAAGARLALVDRAPDRLPRIFPQFTNSDGVLLIPSIDLRDEDATRQMAEQTVSHFGQVDALIQTAGGYRAGDPVETTSLQTWNFMLDLNARSTFLSCRAVIPYMRARKMGKIVLVGAYNARTGKPRMAAYSVAKSAVIRLTESLAEGLRDANVNVNCVLPNVIDTPSNRAAMPDADFNRWVKPEAIADVMVFLASRAARSIYGASIPVRGPC